jgi:hypothetical protein
MTPGIPIVAQSAVAQAIASQAPRVPTRAAAIAASGIAAIASGYPRKTTTLEAPASGPVPLVW